MPDGTGESAGPDAGDSEDLSSAEAAEAAAAAAEARAEAARARAIELRRKIEAARSDEISDRPDTDAEPAVEAVEEAGIDSEPETPARRRLRGTPLQAIASTLAVLVIAGLLAGTGYMVWQHRKATDERHRTAEFSAAARQGVVNLMSMDYTKAEESVQRVIDDSTGKFKDQFSEGSDDLIKAMQDSKVITKVTVNNTAVESMTADSAVVLIAATSERGDAKATQADKQPRVWRVALTVVRDGGQLKMSDVQFV